MVAGGRHQGKVLAVCEHQQRHFFAEQTFFENDLFGGVGSDQIGHFVYRGDGLGTVCGNNDAFSGGKAIGLNDDR